MSDDKLESFITAFSSCTAGARRDCECGKTFYNPGGGWDWHEGELEKLSKNGSEAIHLEYSVGTVQFDGKEYVIDCQCWHERARKIMSMLDYNAEQIAEYLTCEKARKQREANASPVVVENLTQ